MIKRFSVVLFALVLTTGMPAQQEAVIMSYNILNYPGNDTTVRNPYFRTVINNINPDILVIQEILSQSGMNQFLNNIMNSSGQFYEAGTFIDGPDTDNGIFFKPDKFEFIENKPIKTALRDINEFIVRNIHSGDTLRIYSVHLKASNTADDRQKRAAEVDSLRKVTNKLWPSSYFLVLGDFNIYSSTEPAYQKLLEQMPGNYGHLIDPFPITGTFNNPSYAQHHTQSTRTRSFGGGANGGLDDRFDMILYSSSLSQPGGVYFVPGSYTIYGNDGLHYNDSINRMPNSAVSQQIADALHYASDHLPIYATFLFEGIIPVELIAFTSEIIGTSVHLNWQTASETNNNMFVIERMNINAEGFWRDVANVFGAGNSTVPLSYFYEDKNLLPGNYQYRLRQVDFDGSFSYSNIVRAEINSPLQFTLSQNYPNPFNPQTTVAFSVVTPVHITLRVFNTLGEEVAELINETIDQGNHTISFDGSGLPSGTYIYRLTDGYNSIVRKMTLIK